jgi:hypothetical protein
MHGTLRVGIAIIIIIITTTTIIIIIIIISLSRLITVIWIRLE